MTNLKDKIKNNVILPLAVAGFIGLNYMLAKTESEIIKKNGGKIMPVIQPWITVYDINKDGNPDKTIVAMRGGPLGAYGVILERKPTQEEVDFYKQK